MGRLEEQNSIRLKFAYYGWNLSPKDLTDPDRMPLHRALVDKAIEMDPWLPQGVPYFVASIREGLASNDLVLRKAETLFEEGTVDLNWLLNTKKTHLTEGVSLALWQAGLEKRGKVDIYDTMARHLGIIKKYDQCGSPYIRANTAEIVLAYKAAPEFEDRIRQTVVLYTSLRALRGDRSVGSLHHF